MNFSPPEVCYVRPPVMVLEREFEQFGPPGDSRRRPCTRTGGGSVRNQCAVRMSVALSRAMNSDVLGAYRGGNVHSARCCSGENGQRHITGSRQLYNYLRNTLGFEFERNRAGASGIPRKGILFFLRCFNRSNGTRGSHIDYWNGHRYTNSAAGEGGADRNLRLFRRADRVYFCPL
jgi:hypothetical protein